MGSQRDLRDVARDLERDGPARREDGHLTRGRDHRLDGRPAEPPIVQVPARAERGDGVVSCWPQRLHDGTTGRRTSALARVGCGVRRGRGRAGATLDGRPKAAGGAAARS